MKPYSVKYRLINQMGDLVTKENFFETGEARTAFIDKTAAQGHLYEILAYSDPRFEV